MSSERDHIAAAAILACTTYHYKGTGRVEYEVTWHEQRLEFCKQQYIALVKERYGSK